MPGTGPNPARALVRARRVVAWVCLAAVLAFAGLDALHHHPYTARSAESHPCRICSLASARLTHAAPPQLAAPPRPTAETPARMSLPVRLVALVRQAVIRPPPLSPAANPPFPTH